MSGSGSGRSNSVSEPPRRQKCCIGALYYSQSLMDRRSTPVTPSKTRKNPQELQELQTETANLADFKAWHIDWLAWTEYRIRQQPDRINMAEGEVNLPYCEGIEVISSRQLQQGPVLLKEGIDGNASSEASDDPPQRKKKRGFFGKEDDIPSFVSQPGRINWDQFPERFVKSSGMILLKMQHNGRHLVESVRRLWER